MTQLPRDLISVRARRIACKEAYKRLGTLTAVAREVGITRQSVAHLIDPEHAEKRNKAARIRYAARKAQAVQH
jgi:hypothetical protein